MIATLTGTLRDWLFHGESGVNAYLKLVPKFEEDGRVPPVKKIYDPSDLYPYQFESTGIDWPSLFVSIPLTVDLTGTVDVNNRRAVGIPIYTTYHTEDADEKDAYRRASYTLRAVLQSFRYWFHPAQVEQRTVQQVQILSMTAAQVGNWRPGIDPVVRLLELTSLVQVADIWGD